MVLQEKVLFRLKRRVEEMCVGRRDGGYAVSHYPITSVDSFGSVTPPSGEVELHTRGPLFVPGS